MNIEKLGKKVRQAWKSRTIRLNTYSAAAMVVQLILLNPATVGITAPAQLLVVNALNNWLRTKTTEALEDKK